MKAFDCGFNRSTQPIADIEVAEKQTLLTNCQLYVLSVLGGQSGAGARLLVSGVIDRSVPWIGFDAPAPNY